MYFEGKKQIHQKLNLTETNEKHIKTRSCFICSIFLNFYDFYFLILWVLWMLRVLGVLHCKVLANILRPAKKNNHMKPAILLTSQRNTNRKTAEMEDWKRGFYSSEFLCLYRYFFHDFAQINWLNTGEKRPHQFFIFFTLLPRLLLPL